MASYVDVNVVKFLDSLSAILEEEEAQIVTVRNAKIQRSVSLLKELFNRDTDRLEAKKITDKIAEDLQRIIVQSGGVEDTLWEYFHQYRTGAELNGHWSKLGDLVCAEIDAIVVQTTTEHYLLKLLPVNSESSESATDERVLSTEEKRAVMYAGGYIVRKIKIFVTKNKQIKDGGCYDALQGMLAGGQWDDEEPTQDFTEFIRKWMEKIDRGGATILSEPAFAFFCLLEVLTFNIINKLQLPGSQINAQLVVENTAKHEDILFRWSMLTVDIADHEDSNTLLKEIIKLWIKMRGHSYASALTETYKQITGMQVKRVKALRKRLQFETGEHACIYLYICYCICKPWSYVLLRL